MYLERQGGIVWTRFLSVHDVIDLAFRGMVGVSVCLVRCIECPSTSMSVQL